MVIFSMRGQLVAAKLIRLGKPLQSISDMKNGVCLW